MPRMAFAGELTVGMDIEFRLGRTVPTADGGIVVTHDSFGGLVESVVRGNNGNTPKITFVVDGRTFTVRPDFHVTIYGE